jgi:hypothetical protein
VTVAGIVKAAPFAKATGVRVLPCVTVAGIVKAAAFAKTEGVKVQVFVKERRSANAPVATVANSAKSVHRCGAEKAYAARPAAGEPRAAVVVDSKAAVR